MFNKKLILYYLVVILLTLFCIIGLFTFFKNIFSKEIVTNSLINTTVSGVSGFELRYKNLNENEVPLFQVGYAIDSSYSYFIYNGNIYELNNLASATIRINPGRTPQYIAEEIILDRDKESRPKRSQLLIMKKSKSVNELMAHKILMKGASEHGRGWTGEHGINFIKSVIIPTETKPPEISIVRQSIVGNVSGPYTTEPSLLGCPPTFSIKRDFALGVSKALLHTNEWIFAPRIGVDDAACIKKYVLVFSGVFQDRIYLDILNGDGVFLKQLILKPQVSKNNKQYRVHKVDYKEESIHIQLDHGIPKQEQPTKFILHQRSSIKLSNIESELIF